MKISEHIKKTMDDVTAEILSGQDPGPVAENVARLAQEAIIGGGASQQWKEYMGLFADNATELGKLIPDGTAKDTERAYLVSNGMCLMGTTPTLIANVTNALD